MTTYLSDKNDVITPWYKQGWPWFLISIPATSIVLGVHMFYLALNTNNSLVVDDYYKQGKSINQRIKRDKLASELGLSATVSNAEEGLLLQLEKSDIDAIQNFEFPEALLVRWIHVTQSEKDGKAILNHIGGGRYIAPNVEIPPVARWRIHVQPNDINTPANLTTYNWRLVSDLFSISEAHPVSISSKEWAQ